MHLTFVLLLGPNQDRVNVAALKRSLGRLHHWPVHPITMSRAEALVGAIRATTNKVIETTIDLRMPVVFITFSPSLCMALARFKNVS